MARSRSPTATSQYVVLHFIAFYRYCDFSQQVLWQPCIEQDYWCHIFLTVFAHFVLILVILAVSISWTFSWWLYLLWWSVIRIRSHTNQRCSEGSNKPCAHQDPETPQRLRQNCFWVSPEEGQSPVDCCRGRGSGCSRPGYGISPLGGGRH